MAIKNISPKFSLRTAESELMLEYGQSVMGEKVGGLAMYANAFKRGYGAKVFGSDENGIWLGAADYPDAPFRVDMDGNATLNSLASGGDVLTKSGSSQQVSGQIVAGGSVNGQIIVKDSSNNNKVLLNSDGITVNEGKITIKNADDVAVIDSLGLVSSANFISDTAYSTTYTETTGLTHADLSSMSLSLTLSRSTKTLIMFTMVGYSSGGAGGTFFITIDGVEKDRNTFEYAVATAHYIADLSSGSHTIKIMWHANTSLQTVSCNSRRLTYLLLGK